MRWILLVFLITTVPGVAQRIEIRPDELKPLTTLPWQENSEAPFEQHLKRIYLESDSAVRDPVLVACLRQMPVKELDAAFDWCLRLEGTMHPYRIVSLILPVWAERDPHGAWKRVETLLALEDTGWLGHDSWASPKIVFRDLAAMRQSWFWLDVDHLEGFLLGLNQSAAPLAEKQRLREAFLAKWKLIYESPPTDAVLGIQEDSRSTIAAFGIDSEKFEATIGEAVTTKQPTATLKVLTRRWLATRPDKAFLIVNVAEKLGVATEEFFLLWRQLHPQSLVEWADAQVQAGQASLELQGLLLSHVEPGMRQAWIKAVQKQGRNAEDEEALAELCYRWGKWDLNAAMCAAIEAKDPMAVSHAASGAVYGFAGRQTYSLPALRDFDLSLLPKDEPSREIMFDNWYILMEQWGDVDIGEAARYGLHFLLETELVSRQNLIKQYSGDDAYGGDSDMIDRTFCSLRMWAALKPEEMKAWIATQQDAEMRKALTWLLNNPW